MQHRQVTQAIRLRELRHVAGVNILGQQPFNGLLKDCNGVRIDAVSHIEADGIELENTWQY